jgi:hypothetical protein
MSERSIYDRRSLNKVHIEKTSPRRATTAPRKKNNAQKFFASFFQKRRLPS